MDSNSMIVKRPNRSRGVAMFVVLGVIMVLTLLGFWGIQMAENDTRLSGGAVDIKSMNMAAVSGLNMAVAQMAKDDDNLVALINAFKASVGSGSLKEWIVFGNSSLSLSNSDPGFTPTLGLDKTSCKVRILGIEDIGTSASTLAITLESTGRGRNGDIHTAVATYRMSGLNSNQTTNSLGPSNAIQSMGGFHNSGFNQTVSAEGGVYSGGGLLILQPPSGANTSTRIRSAGDVQLNADIIVEENSVIRGYLNLNGGNATFKKNLVLYGNLWNNQILDVGGSMYFAGSTVSGYRGGDLKVGKDFLVTGSQFITEGPMTVGTTGNTSARAWFYKGIDISASAVRTIYGSMYVKNNGVNDDGIRDFSIKSNLRFESGAARRMRVNTTVVDGDAYFQGPLSSGSSSLSGGGGLTVNGKSTLMNGFVENNKQNHTFVGSAYWKAAGQAGLVGTGTDGSFKFGGEVSMNGSQAPDWFNKWSFYDGVKKWSYTSMNSTDPCSSPRSAGVIKNGLTVSCRTNDEAAPDWVGAFPDTNGFIAALNYTASDLNVDNTNAANEPSTVAIAKFPTGFLDAAKWSALKASYNTNPISKCGWIGDYPTGANISCIYEKERARYLADPTNYAGPLYRGSDGKHKFLVINIDGSWMNMQPGQVIPKNVHVMFILNASIDVNMNWYTNVEGSTQIIYVLKEPGNFGWNGTVHGFVQFDVPNKSGLQVSGNMVLYGAMESAQTTTTLQPNSGSLKVSITDDKAKAVRDEIVMAFTSNTATKDIIRFSGDKNRVITTVRALAINDGWVQFERLGEYR